MKRIARETELLIEQLRSVRPVPDPALFMPNCLVVEDNPNDAELTSEAIRSVGVEAAIVDSGDKAIELLKEMSLQRKPPFHIVFLDLNLVGSISQGVAVLKYIQTNFPDIHVVVVSGFVNQEFLDFLTTDRTGGGYVGVVRKPLVRENLSEILKKHRMKD